MKVRTQRCKSATRTTDDRDGDFLFCGQFFPRCRPIILSALKRRLRRLLWCVFVCPVLFLKFECSQFLALRLSLSVALNVCFRIVNKCTDMKLNQMHVKNLFYRIKSLLLLMCTLKYVFLVLV